MYVLYATNKADAQYLPMIWHIRAFLHSSSSHSYCIPRLEILFVKFNATQGLISPEIIPTTIMYGENFNLSFLTLQWVIQVTLPLRLKSHGLIRSGQRGTWETWLTRSGERNSISMHTDDSAALPNWPETENYLFLEEEFRAFASIPGGA